MATYTQIMADLQKRQFKPVYFLSGEESYYIDSISDYIEKNLLKEEEKAFNQTVMYGADVQMSQIIDAAKRYPMMSEYTLVIVKEAQEVDGMDGSPEVKAAMLASYIEHPQPLTVLVICMKGGKLDSRRKFAKTVSQKTEYFVSEPLKEEKVGASRRCRRLPLHAAGRRLVPAGQGGQGTGGADMVALPVGCGLLQGLRRRGRKEARQLCRFGDAALCGGLAPGRGAPGGGGRRAAHGAGPACHGYGSLL